MLPLEPGETIRWEAWEPAFHRFSYYAIVVSDRAAYFYSRLWHSFVRWKRYPLSEIRSATYVPSWFMPKLVLEIGDGTATLLTPFDWGAAARIDREQLAEAAAVIKQALHGIAAG
jgi:hypothetical protein